MEQDAHIPQPQQQAGSNAWLGFSFLSVWIIAICWFFQLIPWFFEAISTFQPWIWVPVGLIQFALIIIPIAISRYLVKDEAYRIIYRAWTIATVWSVLFQLVRLIPVTNLTNIFIIQGLIGLIAAVILVLWPVPPQIAAKNTTPTNALGMAPTVAVLAFALALGIIIALPWIIYGALGSWIDTLQAGIVGVLFGCIAGGIISRWLIKLLVRYQRSTAFDVGVGGFAASIVLLILAAGFGFGGHQLLLMLMLPPLGFAAAAMVRVTPVAPWRMLTVLFAPVVTAAFAFLDPSEMTLLLGFTNEPVGIGFLVASISFVIAWIISLIFWFRARKVSRLPNTKISFATLGASAIVAVLAYMLWGQVGLYGERLFIVMKSQADVSAAIAIPDREERITYVYQTLTNHADTTQAELRRFLDQAELDYTPYYLVNAIEVESTPMLRLYLRTRKDVDRVLNSPRLRPAPNLPSAESGDLSAPSQPLWNIEMIKAPQAWSEFDARGQGIIIGESDSGVQGDHPALSANYRGRDGTHDYNWYDPWYHSTQPEDRGGHGTHTLGTIVGANGIGVAPEAEWIGCVNLGRNLANPALYLDCLQFMLAPFPQTGDPFTDGDPSKAAHVLNNSWGCPELEGCDSESLLPAVQALRAAGIFVVASAGNDGNSCSTVADPIAIYDESYSVGAVDQAGRIAPFSSRGPVTVDGSNRIKPDIVAPGVDIISSLPNSSYGANDGTSMAGPHVAGVVALIWSANPDLIGDIDRTEHILNATAQSYAGNPESSCGGDTQVNNVFGYGLVNAYEAVKQALAE
jgi:uncharacterized membrane protein (DUF485 family)